MKKWTAVLIFIFLIVGCRGENYNKIMKEYASDYYETYMKNVKGQNTNIVSIKALKTVTRDGSKNYDLSKLQKCKDSSYVSVIVNAKDRKIEKYEYHMECK